MSKKEQGLAFSSELDLEALSSVHISKNLLEGRNIVGFGSRDGRSRPFNILRSQFMKHALEEKTRLVGVTSATPASGKSFLSVNLAASLSRVLQAQTVLVDLDLRRGCVSEELEIEFELGVSDFLLGRTDDLQEVGLRVEGSRLAVFPTRRVSADTAQLIASERFESLISTLRRGLGEGIIIFDLPPVFANDDAALSTRNLDAFLMVVESGKTSRRQLEDALDMLKPVHCLGTVLNRYEGGFLDSYGYGSTAYETYYGG